MTWRKIPYFFLLAVDDVHCSNNFYEKKETNHNDYRWGFPHITDTHTHIQM